MEFSFERQAMKGEPLPKGLDIADSCLYVALKNLYSMYYDGRISRRDASAEKDRLVYNHTKAKSMLVFLDRESEALKNRIGRVSEEYKINPCVKTADKLYAAFYNLPDNWRKNEDISSLT